MGDKRIGAHRQVVPAGGAELSDVQTANIQGKTSSGWARFKQTSFARWFSGTWDTICRSLSSRKTQPVTAAEKKITTKAEVEGKIAALETMISCCNGTQDENRDVLEKPWENARDSFRSYYCPSGGDLNDVKVTVDGQETTLAQLGADLLTTGKDPVEVAGQIVKAMRQLIAEREKPAPAAPAATPRAVDKPEYDWLKQERGVLPTSFTTIYLVQVLKGEATLRKNVVDLRTDTDTGTGSIPDKVVLQATHQHVAQELVRRAYKAYAEGKLPETAKDALRNAAAAANSAEGCEKSKGTFLALAVMMQNAGVI